ncbi:MAG TPA: bifunctional homocysteine S-methyltransferase/methylenetetrahydrofolate reductase [Candidatus Limnocylindrales bacterium]|nr:bifunctional homocysteine S-methyltransferase/methylenetetrahydrofolate reductase [Candidatus Limnocylindrales bacterium]
MNERERLRERLGRGPLLADGAMGTLLFSRGLPQRACLDELPTTRPDLVGAIHREYVDAGADVIETASFGANRVRLAMYGLADSAHAFSRRAAQVAREARDVGGRDVLVAGSIGPLGAPTRDLLHLADDAVRAAYREQIEGLLEGGVDLFVIETHIDLRHLLLAIDEARAAADLPIVAELTFGEELALPDGTTPEVAARAVAAARVDAVGVNCGAGPQACLDAVELIANADDLALPLSIMPNAGLPQRIAGQFVYGAGPDYFAGMVPRFVSAGARIVGGCGGTTPEHIAAMRGALDAVAGDDGQRTRATVAGTIGRERRPIVATSNGAMPLADGRATAEASPPTGLLQALRAGRFVVSVEIDPPRSIRIDRTLEAARLLQAAGADLVNVSDSAMARVRMGAMSVAFGIQHDLDLECLVHFTTRDRNLMAIESELLGAHALGVRNILALTGDPPRVGDYPTGTGVWDVDSIGLVEILARLNRGADQAGSPIGQPAGFTIACALDPTAADQATEWDRLERKLEAGAHLVMTQPLYDIAQVAAMDAEARRRFGPRGFPVPLLLGILPLQSSRHAEFLHNEVPGITIPDASRAAMAAAGERGAEVGLEMSLEFLGQVESLVSGTYIMPSFGRYEQAAELTRRIRARDATRTATGAI